MVLQVDTDQLDYVKNMDDLKAVEDRLRQTLKLSPYQQELPFQAQEQG
jgi:hypothetical protein